LVAPKSPASNLAGGEKGGTMTTDYDPKKALADLRDANAQRIFKEAKTEMTAAEDLLAMREWRGYDTSFARTALYELDYWSSSTGDVDAVQAALARVHAAVNNANPPSALEQGPDGSFAAGTRLFFLQLDRSTDQILAREWPWPRPPLFLERINDPVRMVTYLQDLCWSDIARCGRDNRKELNLAISVIARLVVKGGVAGYLSGPGFYPAFERFVLDWQDPATGFFGMTYITDESGNTYRTRDLSLTFHMVRYVPHLVRWWPKLIDTLLAMRKGTYPQGWLNGGDAMSDHNNYDVVELFYRGWRDMEPRQRVAASAAVNDLFKWCLGGSVKPDGDLVAPDPSDPIADAFYYAASFLDTVGFFDPAKRFWTRDALADPDLIKSGMIARLRKFNPYYTEIDDALERLGAATHPWTNAVL
jgi:hypothetical protein